MPRTFTMPRDWDKMPLGFYLREKRGGGWFIGGQKSELPGGSYRVLGPIKLPERRSEIPMPDFDGLTKALNGVTLELKQIL